MAQAADKEASESMQNYVEESCEDDSVDNTFETTQVAQDKCGKRPRNFDTSDAKKSSCSNCEEFTKLSTLVKFNNLKVQCGWNDASFSELLSLIHDILPKTNTFATSTYEAKKTLSSQGLDYEKIHLCSNDFCLDRKENLELIGSATRGGSKWKRFKKSITEVQIDPAMELVHATVELLPRYVKLHMKDDETIGVEIDTVIFGTERVTYLTKDDITRVCEMLEITASCMVVYIMYLYAIFMNTDVIKRFKFVDPSEIAADGGTQNARVRTLSNTLESLQQNQRVLIPYNFGSHWILIVMDPYENTVYSLNPLRQSIPDDIKVVTNRAMELFIAQKEIGNEKSTIWIPVKCPGQTGFEECGYYVQQYMREIMNNCDTPITSIFDTESAYSQEKLDEVRVEWADLFVQINLDKMTFL